ncbi:MAG: non-homologous end-joining DNA ligase [Nocardioides sp.]
MSGADSAHVSQVVVDVEGRRLKLTNLNKVLYPRTGTTKGEVIDYYARIAPVILPYLAGRAATRIRWPNGVEKQSFFEKNVPAGTPSWVRTVTVPTSGSRWGSDEEPRGPGELRFPIVENLATLTWLANLAALELHVHQWTVDHADEVCPPNRLVVDLDPGEPAGLHECCQVALLVRAALARRGMSGRAVTSGSKGLHLYATLEAPEDLGGAESSSALAKEIAEELQTEHAGLVTARMAKARRPGRVFVDWSQNADAKTTVAPYSLRGRERPTVATPVSWDEVEAGAEDEFGMEQFTFEQVLSRVDEHGDLFG